LSQSYKICPICDSSNQRNATICSTCGAPLKSVEVILPEDNLTKTDPLYDQFHGETDLYEGGLYWKGSSYLIGAVIALLTVTCVSTIFIVSNQIFGTGSIPNQRSISATIANTANTAADNLPIQTNMPQPTIFLATITQGPPTPTPPPLSTPTPTQGPCTQVIQSGDDLISIIYRCGHRNFDTIVDAVVELNGLEDASRIQEGQTIEVPWPTPTTDPNVAPTVTFENSLDTNAEQVAQIDTESIMGVRLVPTETLQPGVSWHTIQKDENIIIIAVEYGATLRILSELNPEVTFSQCDFGLGTGGENCVVQLFEGQQLRVPAPTPTPTSQPTTSGSETPTPTATPTFNAPTALSPSNRAFFGKDDLITLRWVVTGALAPGQAYLIHVEDQTSRQVYVATTQELSYIIPQEWHGQDSVRHDYVWTISVIDKENADKPYFTTEPHMFTWQGREVT